MTFEPGKIGVGAGILFALLTIFLYGLALVKERPIIRAARVTLALSALSAFFCFFRLMFLVVHRQYQFNYVFNYTSPDLQLPFLATATWAGQEGSFLLWACWTGVIGMLVAFRAGKWEARVMPIFVTTLLALFAILAFQSPYKLTVKPPNFPASLPWPPNFGMGLSPSLQNYWMAIHPPTIFFGFASLMVPFSYAIATLLWREYDNWVPRVQPYVLMTTATLGVGLFMGGYWAYETQGWHGFWGWDPVENASLFPWLGGLALLHGLVVQKSRKGMARTNLFLAIVSWLLFLYGTFLTRSGVLANASVHAFDMIAKGALWLILVLIAFHGVSGLILLAVRWRSIPGRPASENLLSRDTAMVIAVTLMIAGSVIIATASSWPMISQLSIIRSISFLPKLPNGAVQPIFYNRIGSALMIPALILMGLVPYLAWGKTNLDKLAMRILLPWGAAFGIACLVLLFISVQAKAGFVADTPGPLVVGIALFATFCAAANLLLVARLIRIKVVTMGGWLAHVGIGILLLGTVLTNTYENTKYYTLIEGGAPQSTPFGYAMQFAGWTHDGKPLNQVDQDWWTFGHGVKVKFIPTSVDNGVAQADGVSDGSSQDPAGTFTGILPVFHTAQLASNSGAPESPTTMRWPMIKRGMDRDFYVLVTDDPKLERVRVQITPGQTLDIPATRYKIHYNQFYMDGPPGTPGTTMGADMVMITPEGLKIPIRPGLRFKDGGGMAPANIHIPHIDGGVIMEGNVNPADHGVTVAFELPEAPALWRVDLAVTNKPWINLVWLGVITMGLGILVSLVRRLAEGKSGQLLAVTEAAGLAAGPGAATASPLQSGRRAHAKASAGGRRTGSK